MNQFIGPPERSCEHLTIDLVNTLLCTLSAKSVKTVLLIHYFTLGGKVHRQSVGGSIGLNLLVEIAAIYMLIWDLSFLNKLKQLGVKASLYKQYVDDKVILARARDQGESMG